MLFDVFNKMLYCVDIYYIKNDPIAGIVTDAHAQSYHLI